MTRLDPLTPKQRSERMSRVRGKDTKPEMIVRRLVHGLGYRYRLHGKDLPGRPDLVFRSRKCVIFVHGCYWHRHSACKSGSRLPRSRLDFWIPKLDGNKERDSRNQEQLRQDGWRVLVVWECQLRDRAQLTQVVTGFLEGEA